MLKMITAITKEIKVCLLDIASILNFRQISQFSGLINNIGTSHSARSILAIGFHP